MTAEEFLRKLAWRNGPEAWKGPGLYLAKLPGDAAAYDVRVLYLEDSRLMGWGLAYAAMAPRPD